MKRLLKALLLIIIYIVIVFIILWKTGFIQIKIFEKTKTVDEYINNGLSLKDETLQIATGKEDRFYYNQLDKTGKTIYDKIIQSKEELKNGRIKIEFEENTFNSILSKEDGMQILSEKYQEAVDSLRYDNLDLFYVDFSKMILQTITYTKGRNVTYEVYLTEKEGENFIQDDLQNKDIDQILDEIAILSDDILSNANGTDYQKIQYIHNWIVDNLQYDTTYNLENNRNIYGALTNKNVVCEGYAKLFKYLLDKEDIPCIIVSGDAINSEGKRESHMWNYVKINDTWYAFDVTWDDPILTNSDELPDEYRYKYFCQGDNINSNHFITNTITDKGKEFEYPELYHKEQ